MTTTFVNRDVRNIFENMFKNNDEDIIIEDADEKTSTTVSLLEYLNVKFYSWRNRVIDDEDTHTQLPYKKWVESIEEGMNSAYGLVEIMDETTQISPDLDNGVIDAKVTFMINADKIEQLEYYIAKLRGAYKGKPQELVSQYGTKLTALLYVGALIPSDEPTETQIGDTIICECGFSISYMLGAQTYTDEKLQISLDGINYYDIILSKDTHQLIFQGQANPKANRADCVGDINTSASRVQTLTFFILNDTIASDLDDIFMSYCAQEVWDVQQGGYVDAEVQNLQRYLYVKVEKGTGSNKKGYIYKDIINNMEKVRQNTDFTIMSVTLKTSSK